MSPTLADVARAAGVSRQLVSAVLAEGRHANVRYSPATEAAVLAAVERLGWRRNRQATQMRARQRGTIAVLASNLNLLPANTLDWLVKLASQHGLLVVLERLGADSDQVRLLHEDYADGVIVFETVSDALRADFVRLGLPLVEVHSEHRSSPGCVVYDIDAAVAQAVTRWHDLGCRNPAFLGPTTPRHFSCDERFAALRRHARRAGMTAAKRCEVANDPAALAKDLDILLATCDAILLNNDHLAGAVYQAAARMGRRPGQDLHLIGFDAGALAGALQPAVPSFRIVPRLLAEAVFDQLSAEIAAPGSTTPRLLPYHLERQETP